MPRYRYICNNCNNEQIVFHLFNEKPAQECKECGLIGFLEKMMTIPLHFKTKPECSDMSVGDITKEYIEKNREILEEEKQKFKEKTYEQT